MHNPLSPPPSEPKLAEFSIDNAQDPWQTMLHSLPGMSAAKAVTVATAYPSMRAIGQAEESELASLVVLAEGKKPRKLGPVLAKVLARLN